SKRSVPMRFAIRGKARVALAALSLVGAASLGPVLSAGGAAADTSVESTYLVLYHAGAGTAGAASAVSAAGGPLAAESPQIGVVAAPWSGGGSAAAMEQAATVDAAVGTGAFAAGLHDDQATDDTATPADAPSAWGDRLSGRQWDMTQINV